MIETGGGVLTISDEEIDDNFVTKYSEYLILVDDVSAHNSNLFLQFNL